MRRALALTCLVLGVSAVLPAAASASFPWFSQSEMLNEPDPALRETFIVGTAPGETISRSRFLSQPYLSFFEGEGFDRNFFTWAPHASVGDEYMTGRGWTGCGSVQVPVAGGPSHCAPGAVEFGAPGSMREEVLNGLLGGYKWGETFVSDVCGCWSPTDTAPKDSPMPVIEGVKYEDQNADGVREQGEPGLPGWGIHLFFNNKEVASTTTGAGGAYSFPLNADAMPTIGAGTYALKEESREGWHQQKAPKPIFVSVGAGDAHFAGNDFGNSCRGGLTVEPVDGSTGDPLPGIEVTLEEVSVPGVLKNEPSLPRTVTGPANFSELLPGTYRVVAYLPEGVFTTDPVVIREGRFAIVREVTVNKCEIADLPLHLFTQSTAGKVTGGVKIALPSGYASAGFEFMTKGGAPRGTLQYQDPAAGLNLRTATIEAISVTGNVASVWGKVDFQGGPQRFHLRLVDAGEPGREDRFELTVAPGYEAGQGETISSGNVQLHS
jgi:hypothetical protein